jgi:hypothetical protein
LLACLAVALASCHAIRPLEIADARCHCSSSSYCRVRPMPEGANARFDIACVPLPPTCLDTPTCGCVGRPIDACREELGAITLIEPREVPACDACSSEEYCWRAATTMCRVIPARCEEKPSCGCLLQVGQTRSVSCSEEHGAIIATQSGP